MYWLYWLCLVHTSQCITRLFSSSHGCLRPIEFHRHSSQITWQLSSDNLTPLCFPILEAKVKASCIGENLMRLRLLPIFCNQLQRSKSDRQVLFLHLEQPGDMIGKFNCSTLPRINPLQLLKASPSFRQLYDSAQCPSISQSVILTLYIRLWICLH